MAYRRRYFPAFSITTVSYLDKSVTPDKLADGAIGPSQLATGAVSEPKILDESIESKDIKDQTIEGRDIKSGTIEGWNIKASTIPESKMSFDISTRPLTPGVDTVEIQDLKVTAAKLAADAVETAKIKDAAVSAAKLAADAVETAKIKDDAVTAPKIASGAVGNTEIAADAVRGTEIQDGAVSETKVGTNAISQDKMQDNSVGQAEMRDDAVGTDELIDGEVTEPKLDDDFFTAYLADKQVFYDDFLGAVLDDRWSASGTVGGFAAIEADDDSLLRIQTAVGVNEVFRINWNGKKGINLPRLPRFFTRLLGNPVTVKQLVGLYRDANNYIVFRADTGVSPNWKAVCRVGGVETEVDTGIVLVATRINLEIITISIAEVEFYIEGALVATIITDIPNTRLEALFEVESLAAAFRVFLIDIVAVSAGRQ